MKFTPCYKVTARNRQSVMHDRLDPRQVIVYPLGVTVTASAKAPIFCFSTLERAKFFANAHGEKGTRIFKVEGRGEVKLKRIGEVWAEQKYLDAKKAHKPTAKYSRAPIEDTLFFTEVKLTEEIRRKENDSVFW